ncbi:MAG: hypothetical protein LBJ10_09960 [Clostridiales bacterium]|jgi:hypothetical protein|nr:hypothetical protein [Clostridiales bacterium]
MHDMILNTNILPEPLFAMISTEKIRVREANGELRITPIPQMKSFDASDKFLAVKHAMAQAEYKAQRLNDLRGSGADLEMTVDSFLKMTHDETEMGNE